MHRSLRAAVTAAGVVVAVATPPLAAPALGAQTVVGHVVEPDRTRIAGAEVVLLDEALDPVERAVTDSAGAFVLAVGRPGTYRIVVEREGFASHLSRPLALSGGYHEEWLVFEPVAVPSTGRQAPPDGTLTLREDHLVELCGPAFRPDRQAVLAGAVVDPSTGRTVPGAVARAEWDGAAAGAGGARHRRLEISSGEGGYFVFCGIPADTRLTLRAEGGGVSGPTAVAEAAPGRVARVELPLPVHRPTPVVEEEGRGAVLGRIVDFRTGEPVEGAEVRLDDQERVAVTDDHGRFLLEDVPAGARSVAVHHLAYPHQELILPVRADAGHDVLIQLVSEAIPLAPLRVTVRSTRWFRDMRGFTERSRVGAGWFFRPEDLRRRNPSVLLDLVRTVPGVQVAASADGETAFTVRGRRCDPAVFVDRTPWRRSDPFTAIRGAELEAVEVYRGVTEIPAEFMGTPDTCGAVVVWTRRTGATAS